MTKFDIKRDKELIAAGTHFWCHACQVARTLAEISPNPRYCRMCFDFLNNEAALLPRGKYFPWVPGVTVDSLGPTEKAKEVVTDNAQGLNHVSQPVTTLINGVDSEINTRIAALDAAGLKGRDIAAALAKEGVFISYRTVYRRLQGALISA